MAPAHEGEKEAGCLQRSGRSNARTGSPYDSGRRSAVSTPRKTMRARVNHGDHRNALRNWDWVEQDRRSHQGPHPQRCTAPPHPTEGALNHERVPPERIKALENEPGQPRPRTPGRRTRASTSSTGSLRAGRGRPDCRLAVRRGRHHVRTSLAGRRPAQRGCCRTIRHARAQHVDCRRARTGLPAGEHPAIPPARAGEATNSVVRRSGLIICPCGRPLLHRPARLAPQFRRRAAHPSATRRTAAAMTFPFRTTTDAPAGMIMTPTPAPPAATCVLGSGLKLRSGTAAARQIVDS